MAIKVIDASAFAAVLFAEPEADQIVSLLGNDTLAAPSLLAFEVASVCLKKLRRYPQKQDVILAAYALGCRLDIEVIPVPLVEAIPLAEQKGLTLYDAVYVWLAKHLNTDIITLDKLMQKALH